MYLRNIFETISLVVISLCLSIFVYYGFITNMTIETFTIQEFAQKYTDGIFRYRVLGREIAMFIYHCIHTIPFFSRPDRMMEYLKSDSMTMYHALFILNTLCTSLCTFILHMISKNTNISLQGISRIFFVLSCTACISITQYTITPYDTLSYVFLLSSTLIILRYDTNRKLMILLLMIHAIGGILTRETYFIFSAFLFALFLVHKRTFQKGMSIQIPIITVATSLFVYVALRVYYGFEEGLYYTGELPQYNTIKYASLLFFILIIALLYTHTSSINRRTIRIFFIFSIPYFAVILKSGILAEARLWVPHILLTAILSHLNIGTSNHHSMATHKIMEPLTSK